MDRRSFYFYFLLFSILLFSTTVLAQEKSLEKEDDIADDKVDEKEQIVQDTLRLTQFLHLVLDHHPVIKQANLTFENARLKVREKRGNFDPKIDANFDTKEFDKKQYWDKRTAYLTVPLFFGMDVKAGFENNDGIFLNEEGTVPDDGLYSLGVSFKPLNALIGSDRLIQLKKAKQFALISRQEQILEINDALTKALMAYFEWVLLAEQRQTIEKFLTNGQIRLRAIKKSVEVGDLAPIDSVEANIGIQNRLIQLNEISIKAQKAKAKLFSFLWFNGKPFEFTRPLVPGKISISETKEILQVNRIAETFDVSQHPKFRSTLYKEQIAKLEKRLATSLILPKISVDYNILNQEQNVFDNYNSNDYKAKAGLSWPILMRKYRAKRSIAQNKVEQVQLDQEIVSQSIENKFLVQQAIIDLFEEQQKILDGNVDRYDQLWRAELRQFELGSSAILYVNIRENKLIEAKIKEIKVRNELFNSYLDLIIVSGYEF